MSNTSEDAPRRVHLSDEAKRDLIRYTRRTDLRRVIGAIFVFYGVVVTLTGVVDPAADVAKTGGIHINLWTGLCMLLAGILFFVWDRLSPVPEEDIVDSAEFEEIHKAEGAGQLDRRD